MTYLSLRASDRILQDQVAQQAIASAEPASCCAPHCIRQASPLAADVPLCNQHFAAVVRSYNTLAARTDTPDVPCKCAPRIGKNYPSPSQVYYLTVRPGVVKIGYTHYLITRIVAVRRTVADLLATEPGGREVERDRHRQFAADRVGAHKEDFNVSPELARHITAMRAQHDTILTRKGTPEEKLCVIWRADLKSSPTG